MTLALLKTLAITYHSRHSSISFAYMHVEDSPGAVGAVGAGVWFPPLPPELVPDRKQNNFIVCCSLLHR